MFNNLAPLQVPFGGTWEDCGALFISIARRHKMKWNHCGLWVRLRIRELVISDIHGAEEREREGGGAGVLLLRSLSVFTLAAFHTRCVDQGASGLYVTTDPLVPFLSREAQLLAVCIFCWPPLCGIFCHLAPSSGASIDRHGWPFTFALIYFHSFAAPSKLNVKVASSLSRKVMRYRHELETF